MDACVLFAAYSHAVKRVRPGLSYHLACHALALRRAAAGTGFRVCLASTPEEDAPGLWNRVRAEFDPGDQFVLDDETSALTTVVRSLLEREERLIAHVQGTRQLRALVGLRTQHPGRLKLVYTVHSFKNASWKRWPYSWLLARQLRRHADYTMFLSPAAIGEFVGSPRVLHGGRGGLVPLGSDDWPEWQALEPGPDEIPAELRASLQNPAAFRFIYLAAFKPGKGHTWLVDAVGPVVQRNPNIHIILAGWGDQSIRERVQKSAADFGVTKQVILPGSLNRSIIPWLFKHCHAGLLTSRSETFAQCVVEPMAAGLPVVGTRRGVAQWLIMDYYTGIGVELGDNHGLARAIEYLARNPDLATEMGQNAAEIVRRFFDWDALAASNLRIYRSLLSNSHSGIG